MINRFIGFWQSLNHFFEFFYDITNDAVHFIPAPVIGALHMLAFFAIIFVLIKFVLGFINLVKSIISALIFVS